MIIPLVFSSRIAGGDQFSFAAGISLQLLATEQDLIALLLTLVSEKIKLKITAEDVGIRLKAEEPMSLHSRFFQILHLSAALNVLEQQGIVRSEMELGQLNYYNDLRVQIAAGVPGPCLARLGAIRISSMSCKEKLDSMEELIWKLKSKISQYGVLGHLALRMTVSAYKNTAEWAARNDAALLNRRSKSMAEYQKAAEQCLTPEQIIKQLTFVDWCVLRALNQLRNRIGQVNLPEFKQLLEEKFEGLARGSEEPEPESEAQRLSF